MTKPKIVYPLSSLKNTLGVLGASIGIAMSPVVLAADNTPADGTKGKVDKGIGEHKPFVPNSTKPDGANSIKLNSGPGGASQLKLDQQKTGPGGANQLKLDGVKSGPTGASQIKIEDNK